MSPFKVYLKPWVKLTNLGWINGECHDHFYSEQPDNLAMLSTARQICLGQGVDFLCVCQGWAGFNESSLKQAISQLSDDRFFLHFGAEMPKYRFGHTWWLGMDSARHYFEQTMDTVYERYYRSARNTLNADDMAFPFIPSVEVVPRLRADLNAIAIHAHPTSWWWNDAEQTKYITNVATEIPFGLLSGKLWDGLVVMGYDSDHYFYQNLWFHLLNEGYRLGAFSELDSGNTRQDSYYYGRLRTYYHTKERSIEAIIAAARLGHTFVTSGPIVFATVDERYEPGDRVPQDGSHHVMNIKAYASGDVNDYLSYVVLFRNGKISKLWDLRDKKPRRVTLDYNVESKEKAWFVVKVYGKRAWEDPRHLDVMEFCRQREQGQMMHTDKIKNLDVAITSPFYFWPNQTDEPEPLSSRISLQVVKPNGEPAQDVMVEVLVMNVVQSTHRLEHGEGVFNAPINSWLKISAPDAPTIYRGIFIDYPPFVKMIQELWTGRWLTPALKQVLRPGEVPWSAFQFENAKNILSKITWKIELVSNERDSLWQLFDSLIP